MCTLAAYADYKAKARRSTSPTSSTPLRGIKLFADQAFFAVGGGDIAPFLLKKDAEAYASKKQRQGARLEDAVKSAVSGGKT